MSFIVRANSGGSFKPVPPGTHLACCYRIVDLGTQKSDYQGKINYLRKMMVQWEVHGQDEDGVDLVTAKGEPLTISKNYTVSLGDKARLRQDLVSWRGRAFTAEELKGFELKNLLGVWCMLSVVETIGNDGSTYSNVNAITPVPSLVKKAGLPEQHNEAKIFSLDNPDLDLFDTFGDSLQTKIQSSPEWQGRSAKAPAPSAGFDEDDSIPF